MNMYINKASTVTLDGRRRRVGNTTPLEGSPPGWYCDVVLSSLGQIVVKTFNVVPPHEEGGGTIGPLTPLYVAI